MNRQTAFRGDTEPGFPQYEGQVMPDLLVDFVGARCFESALPGIGVS
jgi:hypothetical protein